MNTNTTVTAADFDTTISGVEDNARKATFHRYAVKSASEGTSKGRVLQIEGYWAGTFSDHGQVTGFLDTFLKSAPEKMKVINSLKWTWKTEESGRRNIALVRQAIPNAKLFHVRADGVIDRIFDC